ncbi:23S rRNA (adenine(2503)-C(2))-methyltransferase RlmN [Candidatus Kuenenbacteria bacterium]|nr:23S rRNA (adenine(2503)-C(2))-methyltransferase RlmN [Candidatus Kuenenbacteria bacterium]
MFDLEKLKQILSAEPSFRLSQALRLIFVDLLGTWAPATVFPIVLREKLQQEFPLPLDAKEFPSSDGRTIKILLKLADGLSVESVLMSYPGQRNTVCVSSMVGCPLACTFCATGKLGFQRNLTAGEIVDQVLYFSRYLKSKGGRVDNVVFMGMGEPFLNYDNVLEAIRFLNSKDSLNIGARHFSISTAGIPVGIKKLAKENLAVNLAVSLHAPNDQLRASLMPIARQYPLEQIFQAVDYYLSASHRKVMFEYLLIKDKNDGPAAAEALAKLIKKKLYHLNLMTYNLTGIFESSPPDRCRIFQSILEKKKVSVTFRHSFGGDIAAACGQLAGRKK